MKHLNFLSKSSSRSCGHRVTTLALTVGSPSVHRRGTMLRLISVLVLILTFGVGNAWGVQIYKNEGANGTAGGITVSGNVNTNSSNGNPGNSLANTSSSNTTFTFTGFSVSGYGALKLSIDAAFKNFPSTTNTYPYATVKFYKNNVVVKTDNTTIKWTSKVNTYSTKTIENIPDFDKIEIVGSPAIGKTGKGADATNYGLYMDNITLTGCPNPTSLSNGTITSSSAQLSWSDADDVGSYEVYRSTTNSAPAANATPTTTVTTKSVTFESLTESTTYYWWVRTKCSDTEKSAWVAGTSFATPAAVSCTSEITIEQGTPSNGSFSMTPTGDVCIDEGNASVTISNIEPASGYRFKQITSSNGGTINDNAKTVTNISASTTINVVFEQIPSYKAYFYNGTTLLNTGGTSFQEGAAVSYSGATPTSCESGTNASTTFAGWATDTWSGKVAKNEIEPDFYESTLPVMGGEDVTYYAVFCKGGSQTGGITQAEITTASNGKTAGTYEAQSASSASGNWTGKYAWNTQNSKKVMQLNATSGNSIISPTFAGNISNIEFTYTNASSSNRTFTLKNGSTTLGSISASANTTEGSGSANITGSYTSFEITASAALYIYSIRVTYGSEASNYMTTCCTSLGSINGSVNLDQNSATLVWDAIEGVTAWSVSGNIKNGADIAAENIGTITPINDGAQKQCVISNLSSSTAYEFQIHATTISSGYCTTVDEWDYEGSTEANYTITEATNNALYGTVTRSGNVITGTPAQYCRYATPAYSVSPANSATVSQNGNEFTVTPSDNTTVTINFEPIPVTGVTMSSNAETLEVGGTVDLTATVAPNTVNPAVTWTSSDPTVATVSNGTVTATQKAGTTTITATSVGDDTKSATCAITVVPVTEYKKVTAALTDWSGEYLLVYENSASEAYVWTGVEAVNCYATATISNNKIEKPTNGVKLVVAAMENEGVYSIKIVGGTNNGKYIYGTSGSNGVNFSDDAKPNTISVSSGNATITSNTSFMQYNSTADQKRFRYYKSGTTSQKDVQLYRKVVTAAVTVTDPAEGTGSLSVTGASLAAVEAGSELTVTATPNNGNHYIGGTVTVTKTVGGDDVTATVYSNGTITMPEYAITVSATFTPTYEITKVADGGSIALSYTQGDAEEGYATAGTSVTATATADGSHVFTSISLSNNVENPSISENVATFTMPASAVTVTAEFADKQDPSIVVTDGTNPITELDFGSVAKTSDPVAQTFKLSGLNLAQGTLTIASSDDTKFTVSPTSINVEGTLEETTVTVTPVTSVAGTFNDEFIMISGGGLAQADKVMIGLSLTVQETYTAKWYVNGAEQFGSTVTGIAGTALTFPDAPTPAEDCAGTEFMGWLTAPLDEASANEPTGLIKTYTGHTMPENSVNYYAVFADETPGEEVEDTYSHTIAEKTWEDNNTTEETLTGVSWTLAKTGGDYWGYDGTKGQQIGSGNAPATAMTLSTSGLTGEISSVKIETSGAKDVNATVAVSVNGEAYKNNNSTSPVAISSTNTGYEFTGSETGEIVISWAQTSEKALYFKQIEVKYAAPGASTYSNYVTTCPHCNSVALEAAYETDPANGSITLGKSEVKTCEEATVTIENTPATGYELSAIALSNNITGASVNDAMTQITIPQGAPAGTLTVTATFAAIDYAVTMTQTGGANADLTGAKDDAHYGETINITAEDKDGYQFLGWEASPEVTFVNASALSTSFTMPNEAVEVTAKYAKICTVKFYVGSSTDAYDEVTTYVGNTIDLSSIGTPTKFADEYPNFIGWSETKFSATNSEPTIISGTITVSDDDEYYAVFGNALTAETNNYAKVNAIESGKNYLIVAEASDKFYAMKNTVVSNYYIGSDEVTSVSNTITSSDAARKWQIAIPATGKMTVQNASAGYVYMYLGTGDYKDLGLQEDAYQFSYTLTEGKVQLEGISGSYVQFTSNYKNFAAKAEASDLYLYKQIVNPTEWATYATENVTISYYDNVDNTNPVHTVLVEKGNNTVDLTYEPEARAGYTFTGWSLTTNGNVEASLTNVDENTPLYAIWAINHKTTIKFYAKGSDDPIATHDQTQGLAYAIPDLSTSLPPVPQGFTFVGWSASQINNEAAAYTQVTSVTPDVAEADNEMALYAVYNREVTGSGDYEKVTTARADWSGQYLIVNEANNVAFNGNINGSFDVTNNIISVSISENTIAQSASMDNASFTFAQVEGGYSIRSHSGYYIGRTSSSTGINATDEYNASYVNTPAVNSITAGNNYLLRYNDANDQKRFRYYSGESVKGIVLYRKDDVENNYTTNPIVKYDITYLAGDAENVTGICDADRQEAGSITLCDAPTCFDKDFQGWNDGSQTYAAGAEYTLSADVTFTATWTPKPTYNVTYNTSGSAGTTPTDETDYYEGDEVTLASASGLSNAGYVFNGWSDGTQVYAAGYAEYAMPDHDVTFTATWAEISSEKWVLVTHEDALEIDGEYAIVSTFEDNNHVIQNFALGEIVTMSSNKAGQAEAVTRSGNIVRGSTAMVTFTLKAGSASGQYAFKNGDNYLTWTSENTLNNANAVTANSSWTITISETSDIATIANASDNTRKLQYNSSSPRFACYTSAQKAVQLFKKAKNTVVEDATETKTSAEVAGGDITVGDNGNLTINVSVDKQAEDLTVKNGGKLTLSGDKTLKVNNVYLSATMASGKSSQMTGTLAQLDVQGEVYFDITLGANGTNQQWHAFTVPFPVDALNGIYDLDGNKLTNEVNYAIMDYHGDIRATGAYGWKKYRQTLVPGTFYLMTVDGERTTYRFKKKAGEPLVALNSKTLTAYRGTGAGSDQGWNGVGNPNLFYGKVNLVVQVLDPESYTYLTKTANSTNFVVGTPFFYQAAEEGTMEMATADAGANYAPARVQANEIKDVPVSFGNEDFTDYLYVSANEDALSTYETGKDLVKMTMTNTPSVAQIFGKAYDSKLSMVYTPMANNQAEVALELYAPQAGEYTISAPSMDNADLYLTYEGSIIWNLSMGEYTVDLNKGTTTGYGLLLVAQPNQMPTGVDTTEGVSGDAVQKILLNGQLYILRDGHLFDAVGHEMK